MALPINPVTGLQNSTYSAATKPPSQELGQVDFMKLIIAQMQNQDPLNPQSQSDFTAQLAQFQALNQSTAMASSIKVMQGVSELSSATSLLGKTVTGKQVNATGVTRDQVGRQMFGAPFAALSLPQQALVNADARVQTALNDATNAGATVSGKVDRVVVGPDGIPSLSVNGKVLDLFSVAEVS